MIDAVSLLQDLLRCKSVTPEEGGAITLLENLLKSHGFDCHRLRFSDKDTPDIDNLYARFGTGSPHLCFAGHTDVVPVGDESLWTFDPFGGKIIDGHVCGRGAADMKGGVAAFVAAALNYLKDNKPQGSISFLITGDEEASGINGTVKVVEWMRERGEIPDFCLVGEPTSVKDIGDTIKIGRRGTLTGHITVRGKQGHVAYPHLADNPVPKLVRLLGVLDALELDHGTAHFEPSNLEIVNIDIGNKASNVIPASARATFNVRFNDSYTGATLEKKLRAVLDGEGLAYEMDITVGGESFYTPPGPATSAIVDAIEKTTGRKAALTTGGGTSDARFIKKICPVAEFGIVGETMHKTDERVAVSDMHALVDIYTGIIGSFFSR